MNELILASASPRRTQLLEQMGIAHRVIVPDVQEVATGTPCEQVTVLATKKAKAVACTLTNGLVLAADTLVFLDDEVLGKPKDAQDAARMLRKLSGKVHTVWTGHCLINQQTGALRTAVAQGQVTFCTLSDEEITDYIISGEPMDKAGAYGIQGRGGALISQIHGDYYAIVGLSLVETRKLLVWAHSDR